MPEAVPDVVPEVVVEVFSKNLAGQPDMSEAFGAGPEQWPLEMARWLPSNSSPEGPEEQWTFAGQSHPL